VIEVAALVVALVAESLEVVVLVTLVVELGRGVVGVFGAIVGVVLEVRICDEEEEMATPPSAEGTARKAPISRIATPTAVPPMRTVLLCWSRLVTRTPLNRICTDFM
jgi:hypothetical protein